MLLKLTLFVAQLYIGLLEVIDSFISYVHIHIKDPSYSVKYLLILITYQQINKFIIMFKSHNNNIIIANCKLQLYLRFIRSGKMLIITNITYNSNISCQGRCAILIIDQLWCIVTRWVVPVVQLGGQPTQWLRMVMGDGYLLPHFLNTDSTNTWLFVTPAQTPPSQSPPPDTRTGLAAISSDLGSGFIHSHNLIKLSS